MVGLALLLGKRLLTRYAAGGRGCQVARAVPTGGHAALHGAGGARGRREPSRLRDGAQIGGHVRHGASSLGAGLTLRRPLPGHGRATVSAALRGRDR